MKKLIRKIKMSIIPMVIAEIGLMTSRVFAISSDVAPTITCYEVGANPEPISKFEIVGKWAVILLPILVVIAIIILAIKKIKKKKTVKQKVEEVKDKIKEPNKSDKFDGMTCYQETIIQQMCYEAVAKYNENDNEKDKSKEEK